MKKKVFAIIHIKHFFIFIEFYKINMEKHKHLNILCNNKKTQGLFVQLVKIETYLPNMYNHHQQHLQTLPT